MKPPKVGFNPKTILEGRQRLAAVALLAVVLAAAATGYFYLAGEGVQTVERTHPEESQAKQLAAAYSRLLKQELDAIRQLLDGTELAPLLEAGDREQMRTKETALAALHPLVQGVRLLQKDTFNYNPDSTPPITYATLELLGRAENSDKPLPPDAQLYGTDTAHIALVTRIAATEGGLAGYVLIGIDPKLPQELLDRIELKDGSVEIVQKVPGSQPQRLAHRGGESDGKVTTAPLLGSSWKLNHAERAIAKTKPTTDSIMDRFPPIAIAAVPLLLLLGAGAFYLHRRRSAPAPAPVLGGAIDQLGQGDDKTIESIIDRGLKEEPEMATPPSTTEQSGLDMDEDENGGQPLIPTAIFRTYDIRGTTKAGLTPAAARMIGVAIGSEAQERGQQTLVVGRDGRSSSPELAKALIEGLRSSGRDVIDVGLAPTPVLYFAAYHLETESGVMVTGSHNPPEYNGFKIMLGGETLSGDAITAIKTRLDSGEMSSGEGNLQQLDIGAEYIRRVTEDIPATLGNAYKLVVDCGNGVAGELAPRLYSALGHDVTELHCEIDGNFPNHHPDPGQPDNLQDLIDSVEMRGADLGLAFDGDGDRLGVVDNKGNIVWVDRLMMLFARDVLSRNPGAEIIYDVKCSSKLPAVIKKLGGKPLLCKTGHSLIKAKMRETGALLGGELSGHIFIKERWYGFDDAMYAGARLLELLRGIGASPTEVFAKLPGAGATPELRIPMAEGENYELMQRLEDNEPFTGARLTQLDGIRVDYKDGWGLVRASNTEPCLVLRFEGDNSQALERIQEQFREALLAVKPDLTLPF